ncbi:hypothetical protein ACFLTH_07985 [Bacteroidota bacterium]
MSFFVKKGFSFGITTGVITTLGLMMGLYTSSGSRMIIIGGVLTIAVADAMSDALGMHISEESDKKRSSKYVWKATFRTLFSKLIFALTFLIPVLLFDVKTAIVVSVIWGLLLLSWLSYNIAKIQKEKPIKVITEHLTIAIIVLLLTNLIGRFISSVFV